MSLIIEGTAFKYTIDTQYNEDGFIACGTESIVYKGKRTPSSTNSQNIEMDCVIKFKRKGYNNSILNRFKSKDMKIFNALQGCRSIVRIFDIIEDIGTFSLDCQYGEANRITNSDYFCVVEEYIDGKTLEQFCLEYGSMFQKTPMIRREGKKIIHYHLYNSGEQTKAEEAYNDYDLCIAFQRDIYEFMDKLCNILGYMLKNRVLHLDIKPDNIMITNAGNELVLIDFGRSDYMKTDEEFVVAKFDNQSTEEYGTVGFAAPEAFSTNREIEPDFCRKYFVYNEEETYLTVESDIFSFGATFWECINIFRIFMKSREFADKIEHNQHFQYIYETKEMLNDDAYCDRDISYSNSAFHENLEKIITKCTKKRAEGYKDETSKVYKEYYHSYEEIHKDILEAKNSSPAVVKTESIKVRNSFGLAGVMFAVALIFLLIDFIVLKPFNTHYSNSIIDTRCDEYIDNDEDSIDNLEEEAIKSMRSADETEKQNIYNKVSDAYHRNNDLSFDEFQSLVIILKNTDNQEFKDKCIDEILLLNINKDDFDDWAKYVAINFESEKSVGYILALNIYNAMEKMELYNAYLTLLQYYNNLEFRPLVLYLANSMNEEERINKISKEMVKLYNDFNIEEANEEEIFMKTVEAKNEIKNMLESLG